MNKLILIAISLIIFSCNPFITKDLRKKKRCNKKLERVISKCPQLLSADTIKDTVEIVIEKVRLDSFFVIHKDTNEIDSLVNLIKNKKTRNVIKKYITEYIPFKDTVIHLMDGYKVSFSFRDGNIHYSIDKPLEVVKIEKKTIVPVVRPIELTWWEQILDFLSRFWYWFVAALVVLSIYRVIKANFL